MLTNGESWAEEPLPRPLPEAGRGDSLGYDLRRFQGSSMSSLTQPAISDSRPSPLRGGDGGGVARCLDRESLWSARGASGIVERSRHQRELIMSPHLQAVLILAVGVSALAPCAAQPRLDASGDPLPEGAILRIGSTRYRSGEAQRYPALSPDEK